MTQPIDFRIDGLKELEQQVLQLTPRLARRALARSAFAGAAIIRNEARKNARALRLRKTGNLVRGIRVKRVKTPNWRTTAIYGVGHSRKGWYGALHERGYHPRGGKTKVHNPHLRPAFDENLERAANAVKERLDRAIRELWPHGSKMRMYK